MDAATWLRQVGGESAQEQKRTQLSELCAALAGFDSLDGLLFEGMERVAVFFAAERAAVFIPDLDNHLRAVAWIAIPFANCACPAIPATSSAGPRQCARPPAFAMCGIWPSWSVCTRACVPMIAWTSGWGCACVR
jgi:hypothetical protein